ncbi:MAG TPA: glutathione S-transferase family protein [Rhizomicrobium sp.]|jgi:glutathione S-transferase|nr:glutathione S-transferase family protein [Rhizomicrobium sp.]
MITIYGGWPTRAFRVAWALEELGLDYRIRPVDLRKRNEDSEFMAINPAGFVPVMEEDGLRMIDSIAMLEYIQARYDTGEKLAPRADDSAYPLYQQFLHLGESGLAAYLNIVVMSRFTAPDAEKDNFGARAAVRMFRSRLDLVERRLRDAAMMAGDRFTAADISVTYAFIMADMLGLGEIFGSEIAGYRARMEARPAFERAKARTTAAPSNPSR